MVERTSGGPRAAFLAHLRAGASVSEAARLVGRSRQSFHKAARNGDHELAAAMAARRAQGGPRGRPRLPVPAPVPAVDAAPGAAPGGVTPGEVGAADLRALALQRLRGLLEDDELPPGALLGACKVVLAIDRGEAVHHLPAPPPAAPVAPEDPGPSPEERAQAARAFLAAVDAAGGEAC